MRLGEGLIVETYCSLKEAAKKVKVNPSSIWLCLNGKIIATFKSTTEVFKITGIQSKIIGQAIRKKYRGGWILLER